MHSENPQKVPFLRGMFSSTMSNIIECLVRYISTSDERISEDLAIVAVLKELKQEEGKI